jgi:mRNA interferase HicA
MKRKDLIKYLKSHGCQFVREGRAHSVWYNPGNDCQTSIPRHNEVTAKTARKVCRQLAVPPPKFA